MGFALCDVLSVTERTATVVWKTAGEGRMQIRFGGHTQMLTSSGRLQRHVISGIDPDVDYVVRVASSEEPVRELCFRTLPVPHEEPVLTFAVVADPHVSFGKASDHGRLFDESRQLLQETVEGINAQGIQLVILPGDITEDGLETEMREAKKTLDDLNCPWLPVFGDHELVGNTAGRLLDPGEQRRMWCEIFERKSTFYSERHGDTLFVALDASTGSLGVEQMTWLENELASAKCDRVVIASHRGLLPYPTLIDDECVTESDDVTELLRQHGRVKAVFAGHKNVPSRHCVHGIYHFACPQICEFPCGYLVVKVYDDLWTYSFRGIRSDELIDKSFALGLKCGRPEWNPTYRIGQPDGRNGVLCV